MKYKYQFLEARVYSRLQVQRWDNNDCFRIVPLFYAREKTTEMRRTNLDIRKQPNHIKNTKCLKQTFLLQKQNYTGNIATMG